MLRTAAAIVALWVASMALQTASANPDGGLSAQAILEQQRSIRADVESGKGVYGDLGDAKRSEILAKQARVEAMLTGINHTSELPESAQIDLANTLESIRSIVAGVKDERKICQRHKPIGSNRPVTVCRTAAQLRAEREAVERDAGRRTIECSEATMGAGGCARN